ncbi:MAG: hypothetical protein L6R37_007914 [Teloschistes peruensis]|nr:MAG: hypothetical protein L6R37_007914 [Teloschistes peruensis]
MLFFKSLCILSAAYSGTAIAIPVDGVQDAPAVAQNQSTAINDHASFQPLLRCDNEYSPLNIQGNNLAGVPGLQDFLAGIIKGRSNEHRCDRTSGKFADISYEFEATGRNCDTQADTAAIRDAVRGYLQWMTNNRVDGACAKMSNCGTWRGYLQIKDHNKGLSTGECRRRLG